MEKRKYKSVAMAIAMAVSMAALNGSTVYAAETLPAANTADSEAGKTAVAGNSAEKAQQEAGAEVKQAAADTVADTTGSDDSQPEAIAAWSKERPEEKSIVDSAQQMEGKTIVDIAVEGAGESTLAMAKAAILSHPGDTFTADTSNKDRDSIYQTGYFYDIYPSYEVVPEGVVITYHVLENPILEELEIVGNTAESTETLQQLITVKTGEILDSKKLHDSVEAIRNKYHDDGYILVKINDMNIDKNGKMTIKINEGILEDYKVKGNEKTKDRVILREMRMKKGEPFNANKARRSMQRVYNLGFFEDVNMKLNPGVEPNAVVLEIDVVEKNTGNFAVGAGYSSKDGFLGMVSIGDSNFRGTGDAIKVTYEFSGDDRDAHGWTFSYTKPWMDSKQTTGTLKLYNRTYKYSDYDTEGDLTEEYMRKYSGGEITLGRPVSEYSTNYITLRNRDDEYVKHKGGPYDRSSAEIWKKDNFGLTRSVTLEHVTDTRDNIFSPTTGNRVSLSAEVAGFGGDFDYRKYTIKHSKYFPLGHGHVLALRGEYGHGDGHIPESAQYKIGGQDSLRGYRDDQFRGNNMALGTIEYRFPVVSKLQGALFTDFGGAWESGWTPDHIYSSVGIGFLFQTPMGPIRLDLGHGSQGNRFHFSIGSTF